MNVLLRIAELYGFSEVTPDFTTEMFLRDHERFLKSIINQVGFEFVLSIDPNLRSLRCLQVQYRNIFDFTASMMSSILKSHVQRAYSWS